jgi:hypothetical protein
MAKHWMQGAVKHSGALRATAKRQGLIKGSQTLSHRVLEKLKGEGGKTAKRATLAETFARSRKG